MLGIADPVTKFRIFGTNHVDCKMNKYSFIFFFLLLSSCTNQMKVITENVDDKKIVIYAQAPHKESSRTIVYDKGKDINCPPNIPGEKIIHWYIVYDDTLFCQFALSMNNWKNRYKCTVQIYKIENQLYCAYKFKGKDKHNEGSKAFTIQKTP